MEDKKPTHWNQSGERVKPPDGKLVLAKERCQIKPCHGRLPRSIHQKGKALPICGGPLEIIVSIMPGDIGRYRLLPVYGGQPSPCNEKATGQQMKTNDSAKLTGAVSQRRVATQNSRRVEFCLSDWLSSDSAGGLMSVLTTTRFIVKLRYPVGALLARTGGGRKNWECSGHANLSPLASRR